MQEDIHREIGEEGKIMCQYLVDKWHCKLKLDGKGFCWLARGGEEAIEDKCWVPKLLDDKRYP